MHGRFIWLKTMSCSLNLKFYSNLRNVAFSASKKLSFCVNIESQPVMITRDVLPAGLTILFSIQNTSLFCETVVMLNNGYKFDAGWSAQKSLDAMQEQGLCSAYLLLF
ncbi:hypothetical protein OIU76_022077 [Salix suchowensis]|nr:hypothetical protein OIU76_022077 [Salix suchowensis]